MLPDTPVIPMDAQRFDALVAQAGIPLTPAQVSGIRAVWNRIEAWRAQVRTPMPTLEAEPATTFSAEAGR